MHEHCTMYIGTLQCLQAYKCLQKSKIFPLTRWGNSLLTLQSTAFFYMIIQRKRPCYHFMYLPRLIKVKRLIFDNIAWRLCSLFDGYWYDLYSIINLNLDTDQVNISSVQQIQFRYRYWRIYWYRPIYQFCQ